jgi:hypothetical protein
MVWSRISWDGCTELVEVNLIINADRCISNIIEEHVLYVGFIGYERFVFMHDNARAYAAETVHQYTYLRCRDRVCRLARKKSRPKSHTASMGRAQTSHTR